MLSFFQAAALVCGIMVMVALITAAFFSYKTGSKIWRHGKPNIFWDEPLTSPVRRGGSADWVSGLVENWTSANNTFSQTFPHSAKLFQCDVS